VCRVGELAGRLQREAAVAVLQRAGREIDIGRAHRLGHFVDADTAAGQLLGVELDADGVLLRAEDLHLRHTADHRDALRDQRFAVLVERVERQRCRGEADVLNRLIGRIDLAEGGRARHVRRHERRRL
jgi:hypothetical protein